MKKYVWVIEILEGRNWSPTAGAYLTRRDAIREKSYYWEYNNPERRFKIEKYVKEQS